LHFYMPFTRNHTLTSQQIFDQVTATYEAAAMPLDKDQIKCLNEQNYNTWIINTRAKLRQKKLWTVCQTPLSAGASAALKEKHTDAIDILILILSKFIKIKLIKAKQNNRYLL
jgi:hypothetical protein